MADTYSSKVKIACAVAETIEDKIDFIIHKDAYFSLSWMLLANGRPRFTVEHELWDGDGGTSFFEFETYADMNYRICLGKHQFDDWQTAPWPVRAFVECYNDVIEATLASVEGIDAIIKREMEKI